MSISENNNTVNKKQQLQLYYLSNPKFDYIIVALLGWLVGGLYLDAWSHHRYGDDLDTFFTIWHLVLYSGFMSVAIFILFNVYQNYSNRRSIKDSLPHGYNITLFGIILFSVGGFADSVWHSIFPIELDVGALYSPPHLLLAVSGGLMVAGPFRAAWSSNRHLGSMKELLPMILSMSYILSIYTFFTEFIHPFHSIYSINKPGNDFILYFESLGTASVMIQTALIVGILLMAMIRFELPIGSLFLVISINGILMSVPGEEYRLMSVSLLAGISIEALFHILKPRLSNPKSIRLFSFFTPVIIYSLYFAILSFTSEIWWVVHLWLGTILLGGLTGWTVSFLILPPSIVILDHQDKSSQTSS